MRRTLAGLAIVALLAGCSAGPERNEAAFIAAVGDAFPADADIIGLGDTICESLEESDDPNQQWGYLMADLASRDAPGSLTLAIAAVTHLCPAIGEDVLD